jgi:hypothetical protein
MQRRFKRTAQCSHAITVSVISNGLERVVCEQCGDINLRYESMISGDVRREAFARHQEEAFLKKLLELAD